MSISCNAEHKSKEDDVIAQLDDRDLFLLNAVWRSDCQLGRVLLEEERGLIDREADATYPTALTARACHVCTRCIVGAPALERTRLPVGAVQVHTSYS